MPSRLSVWLDDKFREARHRATNKIRQWEETYSYDWEPWDDDAERRSRAAEAAELFKSDRQAAVAHFIKLADEGSTYAMRWVGTVYWSGLGVPSDLERAEEYFRRGLCAGSWIATLSYANLLYKRGAHGEWPRTLADGVDNGFIPSFFWQAWYTYRLNPSRKAAEEIRPLLLKASEAGHPGAKAMLARLTAMGRFGLRRIPEGLRMVWTMLAEIFDSPTPS